MKNMRKKYEEMKKIPYKRGFRKVVDGMRIPYRKGFGSVLSGMRIPYRKGFGRVVDGFKYVWNTLHRCECLTKYWDSMFLKCKRQAHADVVFGKNNIEVHDYRGEIIPLDPKEDDIFSRLMLLPWDATWHIILMILVFATEIIYLPVLAAQSIADNRRYRLNPVVYTTELIYGFDLFLYIIAKLNPLLLRPSLNCTSRSWWIVFIDIVSILPIQLFTKSKTLYNKLALLHSLKVVRIFHTTHHLDSLLYGPNLLVWVHVFASLFATISGGVLLATIIECQESGCPTDLWLTTCRVVHHITNAGYYQVPNTKTWTYMKLLVGLPFMMRAAYLVIGIRGNYIYREHYKNAMFKYQYHVTKSILDNLSTSPFIRSMYNNCYSTTWKLCDAYSGYLADTLMPYAPDEYNKILPKVMWTDVMEQLTYNFFYHSIIFAKVDRVFLRSLAVEIKCLVYSEGQLLYTKDELVDKMVYIVSGVVQILSDDDEETSIMDMVSGTCLGEGSLIFPKYATSTFRCAQDSEIQVLKYKDYLTVARSYPYQHMIVQHRMLKRLADARIMKQKTDLVKKHATNYMLNMTWLNHTLHRLSSSLSRSQARRHQLQNIHLRQTFDENELRPLPRMLTYLGLINIAARTLETENSIFLKTTFPYIIHPNGIMRTIIEILVLMYSALILLMVPYMACVWDSITGINAMMSVFTVFMVLDILSQLITAVKTEEGMIIDPREIFLHRITTLDFVIDLIAVLPLEIIAVFFVTPKHYTKFQLNRMAKVWRFFRLFNKLENHHKISITVVRINRIIFVLLYVIYLCTCAIYSAPCEDCNHSFIDDILPVAIQLCTGISFENDSIPEYSGFYFPMMIFSWLLVQTCVAYMMVGFQLRRVFKYKAQQRVKNFRVQIPPHRKDLIEYLDRYVETQDQHGQCVTIIYTRQFLDNLTRQQMRIISEVYIGPTLRKCPLFADLSDDHILEICSLAEWQVKPPGDVLVQAGDVSLYLAMLLDGICEVVNCQTLKNMGLKSGCILNDEILLGEPFCQTIVAVTHCRIIQFEMEKLQKTFNHFPVEQRLQPTIDVSEDIKEELRQLERYEAPLSQFKYYGKQKKIKSFYRINENKKTRLFYKREFRGLGFLSYARYILMTVTIVPEGRFMYVWEIFRSACAILTSIVYMHMNYICATTSQWKYYLLWFLDISGYVDIYVRLHVGFYCKSGIRVQHPLHTAKNYLTSSFIIDFLAYFPFRFITYINNNAKYIMCIHILKSLQLNRYMMLVQTKTKNSSNKVVFYILPFSALTVNFLTNISSLYVCELDDCKKWPFNLTCIQFSPTSQAIVDQGHLYLYCYYIVTSIMTTAGLQGIHYLHKISFFWFLSICSLILSSLYAGVVVSNYKSYDRTFLKYQKFIVVLQRFMRREKVPKDIQSTVLDYYHKCWTIRKGQNIGYVSQPFPDSLKKEVLSELFGKSILKNWALQTDDSALLMKRLLLGVSQLLVPPGIDLLEVNDICSDVYIISKGSVAVKNEDNEIIDYLEVGSIFGNLTDRRTSKISYSFKACDLLHVLVISSQSLQNYMARFHICMQEFSKLRLQTNLAYIKGIGTVESRIKTKFVIDPKKREERKNVNTMLYVGLHFCMLCTLMSIFMYLYQIAVRMMETTFVTFTYILDITYGLVFVILFFLDRHGIFRVHYSYINQYRKYIIILFYVSLVPFELITYFATYNFYLYIGLKVLRLVRIIHLHHIQISLLEQVNKNMSLQRVIILVLWLWLVMLFFTAFLSLSSQLFQPNFNPYIDQDKLESLSNAMRFHFFLNILGYICNTALCITNVDHQPLSIIHTVVMIIVMLAVRLCMMIGIAELTWIIYDKNLPKSGFKNSLDNMFAFMRRWKCSAELTDRVRSYLEIHWYYARGEPMPKLYSLAPAFIKRTIATSCYLDYIKNHAIFRQCDPDFLRQLVLHIKMEVHEHDQYIQLAGSHSGIMYWVHRGLVLQIVDDDTVEILSKGDSFGWQDGVKEICHDPTMSFKALTQVEVTFLERKDWIYLLDHFPESKKAIMQSVHQPTQDVIKKVIN